MHRELIAKFLAIPWLYNKFLRMVGAESGVADMVNRHLRPAAGMRVLDIGCGTGRLLDSLPRELEYTGYDIDSEYIQYARAQYGQRATFFAKRVSDITPNELGTYDLICAVAILHHIDDAEATHLFALAKHALAPGGRLVTCDCTLIEGQNPLARLAIKLDRGEYVRTPEQFLALATKQFPEATGTLRHDLLRIPYTHYFMECVQPS